MRQSPRDGEDLDLTDLPPITGHPAQHGLPPAPTTPTERRLWVQELVRAGLAIFFGLLLLIVIALGFLSSRPSPQARHHLEGQVLREQARSLLQATRRDAALVSQQDALSDSIRCVRRAMDPHLASQLQGAEAAAHRERLGAIGAHLVRGRLVPVARG